jgi:hypothetical protein
MGIGFGGVIEFGAGQRNGERRKWIGVTSNLVEIE